MTKPICLIRVPDNMYQGKNGSVSSVWELIDAFNELFEHQYFVLCVPAKTITEQGDFKMEVFYEKNFTEIQYSELKEKINNYLNKI